MTHTSTQDLIQALRTGPAVTLATNAAADRLEQLERERDWLKDCVDTLRRENAERRRLPRLTSEHIDWSKTGAEIEADYCALVRRVRELEELDAACGRAHQALSDVGIACGRLDERVRAATDLLRWRKQSVEPAPDDAAILEHYATWDRPETGIGRLISDAATAFWRPIGPLPEAN